MRHINLSFDHMRPDNRLEFVDGQELLDQVAAIDTGRCRRLTLSGRAPMSHPRFFEILQAAKGLELENLGLATSPATLASAQTVTKLERLGVSELFLTVGGLRPEIFYAVTPEAGKHEHVLAGLRNAAKSKLRVYLVLPVDGRNVRDLLPLIRWVKGDGAGLTGVLLRLPEIESFPEDERRRMLSYSDQGRLAAHVFEYCHPRGIEVGFRNASAITPCATGPEFARFASVFIQRLSGGRAMSREGSYVRIPACEDCSLTKSCPGIEEVYTAAFGTEEFRPIPLEESMDWKLRALNTLDQREYKTVSDFLNPNEDATSRSLIRINGHCNMSCAFCFVDRTVSDFDVSDIMSAIEGFAEKSTDHLVISGGEPTIHPALPEIISGAAELGFNAIEIQTNGVRAADPDYAEELHRRGLTKATVSLHSVDPEHSDRITRLPGGFAKTLAALHNFRKLGIETQVAHVITKDNFAELAKTVRFLREEFPKDGGELSICFGVTQGISDLVYEWVVPRFDEIKPHMREALDYCLETELGFGGMIGQGGYPPCMLDGEGRYYDMNLQNVYVSAGGANEFYKPSRCTECRYTNSCLGPRKSYVEMYGEEEIQPIANPPPEDQTPDGPVAPPA